MTGTAVLVTALSVLGGLGMLPNLIADPDSDAAPVAADVAERDSGTATVASTSTRNATQSAAAGGAPDLSGDLRPPPPGFAKGKSRSAPHGPEADRSLPADSGRGRRVVFSESMQRVWIVRAGDRVARTYLVSGSLTDNLHPGTYEVFSRSRWAVGVDDSGEMERFVRFTKGPAGAAIGFHTIPVKDGVPLQTKAQLGTPRSHGCIRQDLPDAKAMWAFAGLDTKVVVLA